MTKRRPIHLSAIEPSARDATSNPVLPCLAGIDLPDVFEALRVYFGTREHWAAIPDTHHYFYTQSFGGRTPLRDTYDIAPLSCVTDNPDFVSVESCGVSDGCTRHRTVNMSVQWIDNNSPLFLLRLDRLLTKLIPPARAVNDVGECLIFGECARILNARG